MSGVPTKWLIGAVLLVVLCALRFPWIEADPGNDSFWAYGFFSTDEGWYTSGGRLAYLNGRFLDPEMNEPLTFLSSWGMHALSYVGCRLAGPGLVAMRLPTMVAAVCGWLAAFVLVSRRTSAWLAGAIVLLVSCNPLSLTYERVASTDVIVGALTVIAFALATSRHARPATVAGAVMALALSVKLTALFLFPLIAMGALTQRRQRGSRFLLMGGGFAVLFAVSWAFREWCIRAAAMAAGGRAAVIDALSIQLFIANELTTRIPQILRAVFVFPRFLVSFQLGPFLPWCFALPAMCLALGTAWKRMLIPAGVLIYLAVCSTQSNAPMRFLIPVLFLAPVLIVEGRKFALRESAISARGWIALSLTAAAMFVLYWAPRDFAPEQLQRQLYNEYAAPVDGPWLVSGIPLVAGFVSVMLALRYASRVDVLRAGLFSAVFIWSFFSNYTVAVQPISGEFVRNQLTLQIALCALITAILAGCWARNWIRWYLFHALIYAGFLVANGPWSAAYAQLWARNFQTRNTMRELAAIVPDNAIVIGRRATPLLCASRARLGITTSNYLPQRFVEKVYALLRKYPAQPLFWLIDGDGNSAVEWRAYKMFAQGKWQAKPVTTAYVISGDALDIGDLRANSTLAPVPIYLARVTAVPQGEVERSAGDEGRGDVRPFNAP
jgi:4-amino-4-deoxy-L-arabinose transferase-like glycosyltransferase